MSKILLNGQSFKDGCSRTRKTEYRNETGHQHHQRTNFVFSLRSPSRTEFKIFIIYFPLCRSTKSCLGWRTSPDQAHRQGRSAPYQFPGLGPRSTFWGRGEALPVKERWFKDNMDDSKLLTLSWEKSRNCGLLLTGEKKKMKEFLKVEKMVLAPVFTCNRCQLLIEHPHWCWWWHHPHESPHRGACSGRSTRLLLLCCSLSLLLLSNFSCPLCKGISDFQFYFNPGIQNTIHCIQQD